MFCKIVTTWSIHSSIHSQHIIISFRVLLFFCCLRERIKMTIITLQTAGEALSANAWVFGTCFLVFLLWCALTAVFIFGMVAGLFNAKWDAEVDEETGDTVSCTFRLTQTGEIALTACGLMMMWTGLLFTELRGAVVAGSVGHWYYHNDDRHPPLSWPSFFAAKCAFTKQFGSLCLGSLILFILQLIQMAIRAARESARRGDNQALQMICCMVTSTANAHISA